MNFAIIGCGVIAFTHAKALEALRGEGCVLYGACDIIPEKADAYAAEHGVPHVYYDYHDVLADHRMRLRTQRHPRRGVQSRRRSR